MSRAISNYNKIAFRSKQEKHCLAGNCMANCDHLTARVCPRFFLPYAYKIRGCVAALQHIIEMKILTF